MAVNGEIPLTWGDGEHKFNIAPLKCILELEEKCDAGLAEIVTRVAEGKWRLNDIRETMRLGLIGAGMPPDRALRLINRYVDDRPKAENVLNAHAILLAAMFGVPQDDPLTKKVATDLAKDERSTKTDAMSDPSSTDSGPPSASHPVN